MLRPIRRRRPLSIKQNSARWKAARRVKQIELFGGPCARANDTGPDDAADGDGIIRVVGLGNAGSCRALPNSAIGRHVKAPISSVGGGRAVNTGENAFRERTAVS